jgi:hypothetical protein
VTWITATSPLLDKLVLNNSAILNIIVDVDVSDVITDVTSLVYVGSVRRLQVGNTFDGNKMVASGGTLQLARDSDVLLGQWSFIVGRLDIPVSNRHSQTHRDKKISLGWG